jgi:hypothetical protein
VKDASVRDKRSPPPGVCAGGGCYEAACLLTGVAGGLSYIGVRCMHACLSICPHTRTAASLYRPWGFLSTTDIEVAAATERPGAGHCRWPWRRGVCVCVCLSVHGLLRGEVVYSAAMAVGLFVCMEDAIHEQTGVHSYHSTKLSHASLTHLFLLPSPTCSLRPPLHSPPLLLPLRRVSPPSEP